MKMRIWKHKQFGGIEIGKYALDNGYLDYSTLAKTMDLVLANGLIEQTGGFDKWELQQGDLWTYEDQEGNTYDESGKEERITELEDLLADLDPYEDAEKYDWLQYEIDYLNDSGREHEIFQYYVISHSGADTLQYWTNEIIFYNEDMDLYVWGITHWGTSWDYVLTDIKLEVEAE